MTWYLQKNKWSIKQVFPRGQSHPLHQAQEGTQLFKVPLQEEHPQANDWRNLPSTQLWYQTPPRCYASKIYIPQGIMSRMTVTARAWQVSRQSFRASSSGSGTLQSHVSTLIQHKLTLPGLIGSRRVLTSYRCSSKFQAQLGNVHITGIRLTHWLCIALREGRPGMPGLHASHRAIRRQSLGTRSPCKPSSLQHPAKEIRRARQQILTPRRKALLLHGPGAATDKPRANRASAALEVRAPPVRRGQRPSYLQSDQAPRSWDLVL